VAFAFVTGVEVVAEFAGNDYLVTAAGKRATDQPFAAAVAVLVGGIEEVDPEIEGAVE